MPLGLLERSTADALLAARMQTPAPAELAEAIWARCGGHPGLTVEVLHIAARANVLRETDSGLTLDRAALEQLSLPVDFEAACLQRLAALSPGAQAAAAALAVWATPVRPEALAAIEPAADRAALAELRTAGLLVAVEDGRCVLNPPALARGVLAMLAGRDRVRLHRAVLEQPGLSPEIRFRLWRGAGDPQRALAEADAAVTAGSDVRLAVEAAEVANDVGAEQAAAWAARAAQLLIQRGRYREAVSLLERAIALAPEHAERPRRQVLLSGAYMRTGALAKFDALVSDALSGSAARPRTVDAVGEPLGLPHRGGRARGGRARHGGGSAAGGGLRRR